MNTSFQGFLYHFYSSQKGRLLLRKEKVLLKLALDKVFGYKLIQIGVPSQVSLLQESRVQYNVLVDKVLLPCGDFPYIQAEIDYLPFKKQSIDVVVLPHTLEAVSDPYHLLRQVDKMLAGEGRLIITGFNPYGCNTIKNRIGKNRTAFGSANLMKMSRIVDWLNLLDYDIETTIFSDLDCLLRKPPDRSSVDVERGFCEKSLARIGIELGDLYCIKAKKRIDSPKPVGLNWKLSNWLPAKKGVAVATNRQIQKSDQNEKS